jgi:hypothetical protein
VVEHVWKMVLHDEVKRNVWEWFVPIQVTFSVFASRDSGICEPSQSEQTVSRPRFKLVSPQYGPDALRLELFCM